MIVVKNLTKSILGENLFENVNFKLHKGDKVGLIGKNGGGKTTLLRILLGLEEYDSGTVDTEKERIAYVPQEISFGDEETVEEFLKVTGNLNFLPALQKVGLDKILLDTKIKSLSGGQKTRLSIAKVLLEKPACIFMDEPTNHLDVDGLLWLEEFIFNFHGIVLVISHDRQLLENSVNRILEIDTANKKFFEYIGGYSDYQMAKEKREESEEEAFELQQKQKVKMEQWLVLKKQEATLHADPAKGKQIRAMEKRLQREIYDQELKNPKQNKKLEDLELAGGTHNAKLILRVTNLSFKFPNLEKLLFRRLNFEIRGTQRILMSGKNGSGKTTLIKILLGNILLTEGEIKIGENISIGYFSQEHVFKDFEKSVLDDFSDQTNTGIQESKNILGTFLFSGNNVNKKIKDLSYGERVRLIFAKLINSKNDLLILDEPTNHLDISSREAIEEALINYKGALLVVSHDRYFIETINLDKNLKLL